MSSNGTPTVGEVFDQDVNGLLMLIKPSNESRYEYHIWFKYDKTSMNKIQEGSLIGIENFSSDNTTSNYSIASVTSVMPMHYAIGNNLEGLPTFTEEAAESSSLDWDQEKPVEDTTRIYCKAVPYNMQISTPSPLSQETFEPRITFDQSLPMVGRKARIITSEWVGRLFNKNLLETEDEKIITVGTLPRASDVDILIDWDELVRTHFGIFAYTKAGKSNLLSTVISKMVDRADSVKTLVFDIMQEYHVLLADTLMNQDNACVLCLDTNVVPGSVLRYWEHPEVVGNLENAARDLARTSLYPAEIKLLGADSPDYNYQNIFERLLSDGKFKFYKSQVSYGTVIERVRPSFSTQGYNGKLAFDNFVQNLITNNAQTLITEENRDRIIDAINNFSNTQEQRIRNLSTHQEKITGLTTAVRNAYTDSRNADNYNDLFVIDEPTLIDDLMNADSKSLYVIQSDDDSLMRTTSHQIGDALFRRRRLLGEDSPRVSFVFDEADLFIPQRDVEPFGETGFQESRHIATLIARRGRKFGIGLAIATQRITYLDTSILGQPHTYFVSKLPREGDREKIQAAFGLSNDVMLQTLRFFKGQWLLVSYDATGVEGFPVAVQLPNANTRLNDFVLSQRANQQTGTSQQNT